jgi:ATP-dependent RNA helicase RhlE
LTGKSSVSETNIKGGFEAFEIPPALLQKITRLGYLVPTPIQTHAIPVALKGRDVIGIAQTGTGKTLAFGIPMIVNLRHIQIGLVLAPTRELALQIEETFQKLGVRTALLIGGAPMGRQIAQLRAKPTVVVATPGRLLDHLQQRNINLQTVGVVVLDEADRMLDMGFAPAIRRILDLTPANRQTMLFSATMAKEISELATHYSRDSVRIEIAAQGTVADRIDQELYVVEKIDKPALLGDVLHQNKGTVLVFTRTRHGASRLAKVVRSHGHTAAELHSDRTLNQRFAALSGFKSGQYRILIATDIAARGIDVKEIELVVNYDIPECASDYVHRIGRTGRAGAVGRAITFACPDQHRDVRDIEKLMKAEIQLSPNSRLSLPRPTPNARPGQARSSRPPGRSLDRAARARPR